MPLDPQPAPRAKSSRPTTAGAGDDSGSSTTRRSTARSATSASTSKSSNRQQRQPAASLAESLEEQLQELETLSRSSRQTPSDNPDSSSRDTGTPPFGSTSDSAKTIRPKPASRHSSPISPISSSHAQQQQRVPAPITAAYASISARQHQTPGQRSASAILTLPLGASHQTAGPRLNLGDASHAAAASCIFLSLMAALLLFHPGGSALSLATVIAALGVIGAVAATESASRRKHQDDLQQSGLGITQLMIWDIAVIFILQSLFLVAGALGSILGLLPAIGCLMVLAGVLAALRAYHEQPHDTDTPAQPQWPQPLVRAGALTVCCTPVVAQLGAIA